MKIKKLQIKNYKNLDADLVHNSDLIAFIGNNGSGKSNLLEAISHIFRSLYVAKYKVDFNYLIEYELSKKNIIKIDKQGKEIKYFLDGKNVIDISNYLPQKVVAIYSGEETRLYNDCFEPFYLEFVNNINKAQLQGTEYSELPKMLFLNKFYWNIALLSLLVSDSPDNKKFIENVLRIKDLDKIKIKIDFTKRNYEKYNDNKALRLVRDIDEKPEYTLLQFKKLLSEKEYTPDNVFKYLYLAYTPKDAKIINDIIIEFIDGLTVSDLSEGEKKLLLIKGALEFAGQEDSVFILDEPDSHIHINNKEQIIKSFTDYLDFRQIIITTHSPTLTQCVKDENVYMLNNGRIEDRNRQEIIEEVTGEFWNKHQQNSFLSSKKPIILLVEGKHDKEHIANAFDKLQDEFPSLKFEIFKLNSETNILPFMRGLYESDFVSDKLYIGIYDNDGAGKNALDNRKNFDSIESVSFKKIIENQKPNNSYFACVLPKPDSINCDCTIETMFESSKFEEAYKLAFNNAIGHFSNKSIDSITDNIKEQAKNILSEKSKDFVKEDFKYFRKLFVLINEIKNYSEKIKTLKVNVQPQKPVATLPVEVPTQKVTAKDNHLAYWTAFKEFVGQEKVSFKAQKPQAQHWTNITIGKSDFRLALIANTQKKWICVQLNCLGKNALTDFRKLKAQYEQDASVNLSNKLEWKENEGKQEHHINLVFTDKNPFDKADWTNQHKLLTEWTEKFYNYFKDKLKNLDN